MCKMLNLVSIKGQSYYYTYNIQQVIYTRQAFLQIQPKEIWINDNDTIKNLVLAVKLLILEVPEVKPKYCKNPGNCM